MCGMVGYSGVDNFDTDKIIMLLLANTTRGVHSTGFYCNNKISKDAYNACNFLSVYKDNLVPSKIFMGHDRHATVGNKDDAKNAHPFNYGRLVGQHNGTLTNHYALATKFNLVWKDYDVDSQVLIASLAEDNNDFSVLYEFEGAAALIWHDIDEPDTLYCFRNSERPLYRGYIGKNMYLSSIESSLELIGCKGIVLLKENYVYVITNGVIDLKRSKRIVRKKPAYQDFYSSKKKKKNKGKSRSMYGNHPNHYMDDYDDYEDLNNKFQEDSSATGKYAVEQTQVWVQRVADSSPNLFKKGDWYQIRGVTSKGLYIFKGDNGESIESLMTNFTPQTKLNVGNWVIIPKGDRDELFKTGEMCYLRGLEVSEKYPGTTACLLEKMPHDGEVYTWDRVAIRNATPLEIKDAIDKSEAARKANNKALVCECEEEDDFESTEAIDKLEFQDNMVFADVYGSRLGDLVINVGTTYENLLDIKKKLTGINDNLDDLTDTEGIASFVRMAIEVQRVNIKEVLEITTQEVDTMLDNLFDEYGNKET